jgi:hypothetical protein
VLFGFKLTTNGIDLSRALYYSPVDCLSPVFKRNVGETFSPSFVEDEGTDLFKGGAQLQPFEKETIFSEDAPPLYCVSESSFYWHIIAAVDGEAENKV